ncbi:1-deoxy-D-xylulose-5-phosphate synthase [Lutibacter sp.]|uniref:1-deoxy-D-xylulose-5-phosphate synthase n=1 Tax=Lutibacter sp. TaxID=1925666 RepID=UPI00349FF741
MKNNLLAHINNPKELRKLSKEQLPKVAKELRDFIIDIVATKEGHLGASLGVVELTIALHYVFDTPNDLLIWDVGHQAYGHKILTERRQDFYTNRQLGGISGFPKRRESVYDPFGTGHSSTSISAALGMAIASKLKGDFYKQHIAVIGDASIASGMAFEGLNHAGVTDANLLIILNDNAMGIDPSVGALKNYFTNVKAGKKVRKNNIIEALNFNYSGPIDGHNIEAIITELERLKSIKGPKFLHIITTKGKGLEKAEQDQVKYHAPGKFDKNTGELIAKSNEVLPSKYQDVFGETIVELATKNENIVGITPAMPTGSSLKLMIDIFPERAFDVGIAEQHAVTLAAGMATQGLIPFCTIYSTFLQRAYDQIIHDVAIQNLPVVFCIDRAGLVGEDGATHHGVFDIAYLRCIPNLVVFAPLNEVELRNIMYTAQLGVNFPLTIRYPRGRGTIIDWKQPFSEIEIGKGTCISEGEEIAVLSIGTIGNRIIELQKELPKNKVAHYNMRFVKPLDVALLHTIFAKFKTIVTIEDGTIVGGFGSAILEFAAENNYKNTSIKNLGITDNFVEHGKTEALFETIHLSKEQLKNFFLEL